MHYLDNPETYHMAFILAFMDAKNIGDIGDGLAAFLMYDGLQGSIN